MTLTQSVQAALARVGNIHKVDWQTLSAEVTGQSDVCVPSKVWVHQDAREKLVGSGGGDTSIHQSITLHSGAMIHRSGPIKHVFVSVDEENLIVYYQSQYGNKWSNIAKHMPG